MSCHLFPIGHGSFWTCCVTTTALKKTVSKDLSFLRLCIFECSRIEFCFTPFKELRSPSPLVKGLSLKRGRSIWNIFHISCLCLPFAAASVEKFDQNVEIGLAGWFVAKDEQRPICHWAPNFSQLSCLWNSNGASLFVWPTCQCSVQFFFSKFWLLYLYLYTCRHLYLYPPPVSALYSSCSPSSDSLSTVQDLTLDCCLPLEPISRPLSPAAHSILISLQWNASPPFRHLQHLHHQKLLTALLFLMGWEDVAWSWRGKKVAQEFEMVAN